MGRRTRRDRFAAEYVKDLNGAQAAIRAGYSAKTARHQAYELLTKPDIAAEVQRLQAKRAEAVDIDAEWVLRKLREVAEQEDAAIPTKTRALELIGKHVGMFTEKIEINDVSETPEQKAAKVAALLATAKARKGGE